MKKSGNHGTHPLRISSLLGLAAVMAFTMISLTQCRMVGDQITGVQVQAQGFKSRADCIRDCDKAFKKDMEKEESRHRAESKACDKKKKAADQKACHKSEDKCHADKKKKIDADAKKCKAKCYNEGGGCGGR